MKFNEYIAGKNQTAFAKKLGVSQTIVNAWVRSQKRISGERVFEICMLTDWQVTPYDLRPDLYPHRQDGLPEHLRSAA